MESSLELRTSRLRLESKTRNCGIKIYNLEWMIHNFGNIKQDRFYYGPRVQVGNVVCKLKCMTSTVELPSEVLVNCVYLGLVPYPTFATLTVTILSTTGDTQLGEESLLELAPFPVEKDSFFAFTVENNTADLIAHFIVESNLPDDGDFICKAVCIEERCTVSSDLEQLLREGKYCDIDLVAGGKTFKAHRAILYARSSYFADILLNDDRQELMEVLKDVDSETFEELLRYIYTQRTKKYSFGMALKLLPLSVKFQLVGLQLVLMDHLVSCMSVEYALSLAMRVYEQDMELLNCALECIGNNLEDAMIHKDWKEFRNHTQLVDQLLQYLAKRLIKSKLSFDLN